MTNKQATEAPERQRTPEQIIGNDAFTQLIFEGYEIVSSGELATARQAGIDESDDAVMLAARAIYDDAFMHDNIDDDEVSMGYCISYARAAIRALKSEKANG